MQNCGSRTHLEENQFIEEVDNDWGFDFDEQLLDAFEWGIVVG